MSPDTLESVSWVTQLSKRLGQDSQSNLTDPVSPANGSHKAESPRLGRQVLQCVIAKAQRVTGEWMVF